jgi:Protein of unknown function (DUF3187)
MPRLSPMPQRRFDAVAFLRVALCSMLACAPAAIAAQATTASSQADDGQPTASTEPDAAANAERGWATLGLMRVRDMTPFGLNRLDMLPAHAVKATPGTFAFEFNLSYQNTWAISNNVKDYLEARGVERGEITGADVANILALPGDSYLVDGEFGLLDLTLHHRLSRHWGLYATIPFYFFDGGFLDSTIESFHDTVGFSNAGREFVMRDSFTGIANLRSTATQIVITEKPDNDFGDPVLGARYSLKDVPQAWNMIFEAAVKVPRSDEERLVSTGEADYGVQVSSQWFFDRNALYLTLAGVYYASPDAGLAPDTWIPTVIGGWEMRVTEHLNFILQVYASRSTVQETNLDELSADKLQATLGLQWLYRGAVLRFGITENLANFSNTPDVGLTLSVGKVFFGGKR